MRRTIICCLCLVLWFTLTSLLPQLTTQAGDSLPPGCCQLFPESDFAQLEPTELVLPKVEFVSVSASAKTTPVQPIPTVLAYVPKSVRTWNFEYMPSKPSPLKNLTTRPISTKRPRVTLLWHTQKVSFRLKPSTITIPVRSQRKHIAPVLFWGTGSVADMTIAAKLISHQIGHLLHAGISPVQQLPIRIVRMVERCF